MEERFTQRVRRLYRQQEAEYEEARWAWYDKRRYQVRRLYASGEMSDVQELQACFHLFEYLETLSFLDMVAYRAQVVPRTVLRTIHQTEDDELAEWVTVSGILREAGIPEHELERLNMLYLIERNRGTRKKSRVTTTHIPAIPKSMPGAQAVNPVPKEVRKGR